MNIYLVKVHGKSTPDIIIAGHAGVNQHAILLFLDINGNQVAGYYSGEWRSFRMIDEEN